MALDQVDVDNMKEESEMSFLDHLEALRWHLVRSVVALLVFAIGFFIAKDFTTFVLFWPRLKEFPTYDFFCKMSEVTCFFPPDFTLDVKSPTEKFLTHIRVSVIFALIVAFPYLFWEIWRFIKPALHKNELRAARGIVFSCSSLFISGVSFGYFVITPFALTFLANYEFGAGVDFEPNLSDYVSSIITFTLPTGIVFQMPVAVYFLSKIGLITPEFLKTYRRHAIVIILLLAAIVTPPDVVTQFLIGIPLFGLYEVSIIISRRVIKNAAAKEAAEEKALMKKP
ncbi:MAG: twin-arginine translocase subunit TatC [Saprospiraceae bacterium]